MYHKNRLSSKPELWLSLCLLLCCGLLSTTTAKGQEITFDYAKPALESLTDITENSFTATWSNVTPQRINEDGTVANQVDYRLVTTREIVAKKDGEYSIAHAEVKGNPNGSKILGAQAHLDPCLSQPGWTGGSAAWTSGGITIDGTLFTGTPEGYLGALCRITSPIMDLSNAEGKYTFTFTAKVTGDKPAKLKVFGYGIEMFYPGGVPGTRELTVNNDGKEHEFSFNLERGNWCTCIVVSLENETKVEFTKAFTVKQNLKKGDKAWRGTYFASFNTKATETSDDVSQLFGRDVYFVKYKINLGENESLTKEAIDTKLAANDGERVGCRLLFTNTSVGYDDKVRIQKSMFSDPIFFDKKPAEESNYFYVGYVDYQAPNYESLSPGQPTWAGDHGGAIKVTKELLKDHIGEKVVGLRFATAACKQSNQVNTGEGAFYTPKVPFIFLAKSLRMWEGDVLTDTDTIMTSHAGTLVDGWNSVFFDRPYEITAESEFLAGIYAHDAAVAGGIVVGSIKGQTTNPNAAYVGSNWSTYTFQEAIFSNDLSVWNDPLLIQVIVEPKQQDPAKANKGELRSVTLPSFVYSDKPVDAVLSISNTGLKNISNFDIDIDFGGKKSTQNIVLQELIGTSETQEVTIKNIEHDMVSGTKKLTVTLKKVNGVEQSDPTTVSTEVEMFKQDEAFERTVLLEIFTSEQCKFCPMVVVDIEKILSDPKNQDLVKKVAVVSHHSFNAPDFMMHTYSQGLAPFYGIEENAGDISLYGPSSPAIMISRMPNEELGVPKAKNGSVYSPATPRLPKALSHAIENVPAYAKAEVKPYFNPEKNVLEVAVEGVASSLIDGQRPLYVTLMVTQDEIQQRNQACAAKTLPEGFSHRNVLRIVDDKGMQGTKIEVKEDRTFSLNMELPLATTAETGTLQNNVLLLEGENKTLEDVLKHVNVIALLHYYTPLPTSTDVEENDQRILQNEVVNVAQRRVSFTKFDSVEQISSKVNVYVENSSIRVDGDLREMQVYEPTGVLVSNESLVSGVYVVRILLTDGTSQTVKVIVP